MAVGMKLLGGGAILALALMTSPARAADGGGEFDTDDMQVFGGIKFHLGQGGTLVERHRTGPVDNTSVFKEKLPSILLDPRS